VELAHDRNEKLIEVCSWKPEVEGLLGGGQFNIKRGMSSESSSSPYLRLANTSRKTLEMHAF